MGEYEGFAGLVAILFVFTLFVFIAVLVSAYKIAGLPGIGVLALLGAGGYTYLSFAKSCARDVAKSYQRGFDACTDMHAAQVAAVPAVPAAMKFS
jgi:parvulin-like peptidyl-prolyl isomerase